MTREQIAQWRELMRRTADEGGIQVIVPNAVLIRLLDERKALLTALRDIAEEAEGGSWVAATARAVIAKAEAE